MNCAIELPVAKGWVAIDDCVPHVLRVRLVEIAAHDSAPTDGLLVPIHTSLGPIHIDVGNAARTAESLLKIRSCQVENGRWKGRHS